MAATIASRTPRPFGRRWTRPHAPAVVDYRAGVRLWFVASTLILWWIG